MLNGVEVAVCSQINTKHIKHRGPKVQLLSVKPVGASRNR